MHFTTRVTLQREALTEEQVWALADALIEREIPGVLMDATVVADLAQGTIEVEHYVFASDGPAALLASLLALQDTGWDKQWKLSGALVHPEVPVLA
jgi:hypothetical protein